MLDLSFARRALRDERGVSAVEFAVVLPFMILLLFGGYAMAQAVAISRKVTITTRALADLVSQYSTMSTSDMTTVKNASTQIVSPYNSSPLSFTISQIKVITVAGVTVSLVDWTTSQGSNPPKHKVGDIVTLPSGMPNTSGLYYILSEASYVYKPPFYSSGSNLWFFNQSYTLADHIFMLPRVSPSVSYSGT